MIISFPESCNPFNIFSPDLSLSSFQIINKTKPNSSDISYNMDYEDLVSEKHEIFSLRYEEKKEYSEEEKSYDLSQDKKIINYDNINNNKTKNISGDKIELQSPLHENNYRRFHIRKMKRSKTRQKRYESKEEINQNLKSNFLNTYLIDYINILLDEENRNCKLKKFPKAFVKNVNKEVNKKMLKFRLIELFVDQGLYNEKDKNSKNYKHNSEIIKMLDIDSTVLKILNEKTYSEAYEEYLNSDDYRNHIEEIKERHKDETEYHEKFISLSKGFLDYFVKEKKSFKIYK